MLVADLIVERLNVVNRMRSELDKLAIEEKRIRVKLLASAPQGLRVFLTESGVVDQLISAGRTDFRLLAGSKRWNFESISSLKGLADKLSKSWKRYGVDVVLKNNKDNGRINKQIYVVVSAFAAKV